VAEGRLKASPVESLVFLNPSGTKKLHIVNEIANFKRGYEDLVELLRGGPGSN
jgi:hypothetical protein